jgi:hypothetical protein
MKENYFGERSGTDVRHQQRTSHSDLGGALDWFHCIEANDSDTPSNDSTIAPLLDSFLS